MFERLPHGFPFRFADRTMERTGPASGRVRAAVTFGARGAEGGELGAARVGELMAQAALLLEGDDPESGARGFLAGFSGLTVERAPQAGDLLTVDVRVAGRLGPIVRFDGEVRDAAGQLVARGAFTVRKGTEPLPA